MNRGNLIFCSVLILLLFFGIKSIESKGVYITVSSNWENTPIFYEVLESLAAYHHALYWKFINQIFTENFRGGTDKESYDYFMNFTNSEKFPTYLNDLFDYSISTRYYNPSVILHRETSESVWNQWAKESQECDRNKPFAVVEWIGEETGDETDNQEAKDLYTEEDIALLKKEKFLCDAKKISELLEKLASSQLFTPQGDWFENDFPNEHYRSIKSKPIRVTLYGDPLSPHFDGFRTILDTNVASIRLRYDFDNSQNHGTTVSLQGYGAELTLKNTEYRAVDDSSIQNAQATVQVEDIDPNEIIEGIQFRSILERRKDLSENLISLRSDLLDSTVGGNLRQLKKWEMADLGVQAAYAASKVNDSATFLRDLTSNFPSLATSLSKVKVPEDFRQSIHQYSQLFGEGNEFGFINGRQLELNELNPFKLYQLITEELELQNKLEMMEIPADKVKELALLPVPKADKYKFDTRSEYFVWMNDIETDEIYSRWPAGLTELFKPSWQDIRFIRRNILNLAFVVNPITPDAFQLFQIVNMFIQGKAPVRVGLLLTGSNSTEYLRNAREGEIQDPIEDIIITCFNYMIRYQSKQNALAFLNKIGEIGQATGGIEKSAIDKILDDLVSESISSIYANWKKLDAQLLKTRKFIKSSGLPTDQPTVLFNGQVVECELNSQGIAKVVQQQAPEEYNRITRDLWFGNIKDSENITNYLFDGAYTIYDPLIASIENQPAYNKQQPLDYIPLVSVTMPGQIERKSYRFCNTAELGFGEFFHRQVDFIANATQVNRITHILVLDLSTTQALKTVIELAERYDDKLSMVGEDANAKVQFVVLFSSPCLDAHTNITNREGNRCFNLYNEILLLAGRTMTPRKYGTFMRLILPEFVPDELNAVKEIDLFKELVERVKPGMVQRDNFRKLFGNKEWITKVLSIHSQIVREIFKLPPGVNYIVTNGRVTELPKDLPYFPASGFRLLEQIETKKAQEIFDKIESYDYSHVKKQEKDQQFDIIKLQSHLNMKVASVLLHNNYQRNFPEFFTSSKPENRKAINIQLVLNPLSKNTRKIAAILADLQNKFHMEGKDDFLNVEILLNPKKSISELPLSSYYRYSVRSDVSSLFQSSTGDLSKNSVLFTSLPEKLLFSLAIESPESWLVHPLLSNYDLDNIQLENVLESNLFAEFQLKHLVIQGSALEEDYSPPKGCELVLNPLEHPDTIISDTIIMANLGYFQLKASPGIFLLQIAKGRSSTVYQFKSKAKSIPIYVDSFISDYEIIRMTRNEGYETVNILDLPISTSVSDSSSDQTIHIFSLASGLVYERFLKIMMISVMKTTSSPVKFWFVENFLSPTFKEIIADMKKVYQFDYELVSYQWPSWLHHQTEKQRIIWAYKILFLDVLFPLDVHRVIFIDADLVIRSDLKELNELDLEGAPYAYTPFCDSRVEMEGFRFWKTGFWQSHLESLEAKYHISALYVVDLDTFRNIAAGDILRSVYSQLSQDPNSLANLDQDLPNYTQNRLPIYSLDPSWLWCETWCDDESKKSAKAIDLCNNPLTKTPKLENAVRIVDEWTSLDNQVKEIPRSQHKEQSVDPIHKLIAKDIKDDWLSTKNIFKNLSTLPPTPTPKPAQPAQPASGGSAEQPAEEASGWFGKLFSEII